MELISLQQIENTNDTIANKKNSYLLIGSLALGLLFNLLFFEKPLGLSYPLYLLALYSFVFWNLEKRPKLKFTFTGLLGISIVALSFSYFFFSNPIFAVLNFLMIPTLFVAHTLLLTSNSRYKWFE
ncbi:MAG: DUF4173 domain-containing protein, partial [Bacillota bacterium]|nr:DUF4173 domain-containing protein [Bacillota bacterium]